MSTKNKNRVSFIIRIVALVIAVAFVVGGTRAELLAVDSHVPVLENKPSLFSSIPETLSNITPSSVSTNVATSGGDAGQEIIGSSDAQASSDIVIFNEGEPENAVILSDSDWKTSIEQSISAIESEGNWCSFSMVSLDDKTCIQYNQDIKGYSASCIKAVFCFYILTHAQEPLDDYMLENMEAAIVYSDNDAFDLLSVSQYYNEDYIEWLASYGINHDMYSEIGNYVYITAPSLCAVWMDIAKYIDEGSPEALWFKDVLSRVEVSFIYNGTGDVAKILNKAGWIDEGLWDDYGLNATNDAGIVEINGKRYVLAITTGLPCSYDAVEKVGRLACSLLQTPYVGVTDDSEEEPAW